MSSSPEAGNSFSSVQNPKHTIFLSVPMEELLDGAGGTPSHLALLVSAHLNHFVTCPPSIYSSCLLAGVVTFMTIPWTENGMAAATAELQRYDALLESVKIAREEMTATYAKYSAALSPIRRLPSELLVRIFGLAAPVNSSTTLDLRGERVRSMKHPLYKLAHVCARWHHIPAQQELVARIVNSHLKRSVNVEMALRLFVSEREHQFILDLLVPHAKRYCDIQVEGPPFLITHFLLSCDLSSLRRLCLEGSPFEDFEDFPFEDLNTSYTMGAMPLLQDLTFSGRWGALRAFPFPQITNLSITVSLQDVVDVVAMLSELPHSASFSLSVVAEYEDAAETISISPVIAHLQSMSLVFHSNKIPPIILSKLFENLTLPSLHNLSFSHSNNLSNLPFARWPESGLGSFSHRSLDLRSLNLDKIDINEPALFECLRTLPGLEELTICDVTENLLWGKPQPTPTVSDEFFQELTLMPPVGNCFVPRLRALHCYTYFKFRAAVYLDFLRSRVASDSGVLAPFTSTFYAKSGRRHKFTPSIISELKRMQEDGKLMFSSTVA
ncbi:hypothetical protein C8R43DRAFT_1201914 [Mycena crocata]|nr:hypothetical protein C8R43DRAFT_1201914 [Mycena crocata]